MEGLAQEFEQLIQRMRNIDENYKKKLLFLGFLNKYLNKINSKIIVLGGFAVQFYLAGEYLTHDIDLACDNRDSINEILITLNFEKIGRHYFSDDLNLSIEIPTSSITPQQQERVVVIEIDGYEVPILGLEDIIIDRLNAFVHWQSLEDGRLARELIYIHFKEIDWDYLYVQARKERVEEKLQELEEEIRQELDKK